jgi:sec-independent protein translocase protein TatC
MRTPNPAGDPEDIFADTRMSFGEHIEVLRYHLVRAILGFIVGMFISLLFAQYVFRIITSPVEDQLMKFYDRRVQKVAQRLKDEKADEMELNKYQQVPVQMKAGDLRALLRKWGVQMADRVEVADDEDWVDVPFRVRPLEFSIVMSQAARIVGRPPMLSTMNVMEGFMVYFKVVAMTGLVISSPWVFWQIWSFIAAGLYPSEKKYVHRYLPLSVGLFIAGVVMCQFLIIPNAIRGLLWFNEWLDLEPDLRLNEWLSFAILLPLVFGICFQTPLVMVFLGKLGIFDADAFRRKRRISWFVLAIVAAIVTPVDAFSMIALWVVMVLLYELGILMVKYSAQAEPETEPADELVEV